MTARRAGRDGESQDRQPAPGAMPTPEPVAAPTVASAASVLALQRAAGNRAVTSVLARDPTSAAPATPPSGGVTDLNAALDSHDPDTVLDLPDDAWAGATNNQRSRAIPTILKKYVMFPWNDATLARIVAGYDTATLTDADIESIDLGIARGSINGYSVPGYATLVHDFEAEVERRAGDNVRQNLAQLEEIAKLYGIGREAEGGASGIPTALQELQDVASRVADARHYQASLRKVPVAHKVEGLLPTSEQIMFDPERPPAALGPQQPASEPGLTPWSKVKAADDQLEGSIGKMMSAHPALYMLAATPAADQRILDDDERLHFGKSGLAGFHSAPEGTAKKELDHAYADMKAKLELVAKKLEGHDIDPLSLDNLGLRVGSSEAYGSTFGRWATRNAVQTAKTRKEEVAAFMDFAIAAMLIGATIGTLGGAAVAGAVLMGGATVTGIASAGVKISNAADMDLQSQAGVTPADRMTSPVKASAAELDAAIATAMAIIAVLPFLKGLLFARAASNVEQLALLRAGKLSESAARKAVSAAVLEIGAAQTAETIGTEVDGLLKYLDVGTPEYKLVSEVVASLAEDGAAAGRGVVTFNGKPIRPSFSNWTGHYGSDVTPEQVRAGGGFPSRGDNYDLRDHILGQPGSAFRGTTLEPISQTGQGGAGHWATSEGFIYKINAGEAWDTEPIWFANQNVLVGAHPTPGEFEISIRANVPWERIEGWYAVREGRQADQMILGHYTSRVDWEAAQAAKPKP